jgi:hypothetical protein
MADVIDRAFAPLAGWLQEGTMKRLGIQRTSDLARRYNTLRAGRDLRRREESYRQEFGRLIADNGPATGSSNVMRDGFALDTSHSLAHLDRLLAVADDVIATRGEKSDPDNRYRAFFRNLLTPADLARYPVFLDFVLSSDVLATVCDYFGYIPRLSDTLPPGVRFAESSKNMDIDSHLPPRDSQLFHIDPYSRPMVYVIVLLRDVTPESGPFCFYPASASKKAAHRLGYWRRGKAYRLSDEEVYSVLEPEDRIDLTYPRGTVLFVDPNRCLHYGSRDAIKPRYQMMYGFVSPCRSDFSETLIDTVPFPISDEDSRLRRMVLQKRVSA